MWMLVLLDVLSLIQQSEEHKLEGVRKRCSADGRFTALVVETCKRCSSLCCVCVPGCPSPPTHLTVQETEVINRASHPPHLENDGRAAFQQLTRDLVFTSQAGFLSNVFFLTLLTPSAHSG